MRLRALRFELENKIDASDGQRQASVLWIDVTPCGRLIVKGPGRTPEYPYSMPARKSGVLTFFVHPNFRSQAGILSEFAGRHAIFGHFWPFLSEFWAGLKTTKFCLPMLFFALNYVLASINAMLAKFMTLYID